jgi:hypothetical protein
MCSPESCKVRITLLTVNQRYEWSDLVVKYKKIPVSINTQQVQRADDGQRLRPIRITDQV